MIILTLRTDNPTAEIGIYEDEKQLAYQSWEAHRRLAETIHQQIATKLQIVSKVLGEIEAIVVFQGPGSFTGLRIGLSVANALAYGLQIPLVATQGDDWIQNGVSRLKNGESDHMAVPEYGAPVHITQPKK